MQANKNQEIRFYLFMEFGDNLYSEVEIVQCLLWFRS